MIKKEKILIIKIGALGDVLRTTPILRVLDGEITWVTQKPAFPLLKGIPHIQHLVDINHIPHALFRNSYDLVLSLDEDRRGCTIVSGLTAQELVGTYQEENKICYTDSSKEWFDMSLVSRFGKKPADERKKKNRKSYQEILFGMIGRKFKGEEYILPEKFSGPVKKSKRDIIGLEMRAGERWIAKRWPHFSTFVKILEKSEMPYTQFHQRPTLDQYIREIGATDMVVTTDSLALHIALALGKKVLPIFTCTSPDEIHGYKRMEKIVSPLLHHYYYTTRPTLAPGKAIKPDIVFKALLKLKERD